MNAVELVPWSRAGFKCCAVDTQNKNERVGRIEFKSTNVFDLPEDFCSGAKLVFAFPPCTDLAISGAQWFKSKGPRALGRALALVHRCWNLASLAESWCLENPVGRLSTQWKKPNHYFNPCDYGGYLNPPNDKYNKKTCLWIGGAFIMPKPKPVYPSEGSKQHEIEVCRECRCDACK